MTLNLARHSGGTLVEVLLLEAAGQVDVVKYRAAVAKRDALIAGLSERAKANSKLCHGVLDRLLNPVRMA